MAAILSIETATPLCSVALSTKGKVIAHRETFEEKSHAARLTVFIEEILKEKGLRVDNLDAIAVGKGPGSYTGLRIGVSTAKGLCYGSEIPLIAVSTLKILYKQAYDLLRDRGQIGDESENMLFCPMIDARRMEVFTCLYDTSGKETEAVSAKIIVQESYADLLSSCKIIFFGSGMEKCRGILSHRNAVFLDHIYPMASTLAQLAEQSYLSKEFENLAYFEPFYLKDFVATIPGNKLKI